MSFKFDVVTLGNTVADVIVHTVDELPPKGKLVYKESISLYSGGCAMSSAVDLSKLGAKSAIIAKIGADSFGSFLKNELEKYQVDTQGLKISDYPTSASVALIASDSERTFLHCPGANSHFSDSDITEADWNIIADSRIVFPTGLMIMPSFDGEPCARVLKKAQEMGKITALDVAWDSQDLWMQKLNPCMRYIDYFLPSVEEAEKLSGETELDKMADVFFDMGVKHIIIKLGKDGCYLRESKTSAGKYFPAYTNIKAVDTTGAGDSFCAGFLFGLSRDYSLDECCKIGNAVGAHCVMYTGATAGIAPFEKIQEFMRKNGSSPDSTN
jgi:sugar/nucleoside kinase (ribokinase family)